MDSRTEQYATSLSRMIRHKTVSDYSGMPTDKFRQFRVLLRELFPNLFSQCEMTEFDNGFVLQWKGTDAERMPFLFMNHHDVV